MKKKFSLITIIMILIILLLTFTACTNNGGENTNTGNGDNTDNNIDNIVPQNTGKLLYTLKSDDTYEVSGYTDTIYDVVIPEAYNSKPVTSIGDNAFYNNDTNKGCETLIEVTIPKSITTIGSLSFACCTNLKNIIIPNTVTSIGEWAFYDCSNLTSITIPNKITYLGVYTFGICTNLTNLTIPKSVTTIDGAFYGCYGLKSIIVEEDNPKYHSKDNCLIETATNKLILGCQNSIIPDYIKAIEDYAFLGCNKLTNIIIPKEVMKIGAAVFYGCGNLTSIMVDSRNEKYHSKDNCLIETATNKLILGCQNSIIPTYIKEIESVAFYMVDNLTNIIIPEGVTKIGFQAFAYCKELKNIQLPNTVSLIDQDILMGCNNLENITYNGTKLRWENIQYKYNWNEGCPVTVIHCIDGDNKI